MKNVRPTRSLQFPAPSLADVFMPQLVTVLREGYNFNNLRADIIAGLTVAIVALPLSMAIAIASGATPAQGLYTAIIGGFIISALGGSRFQIGGPAGAFIVLVSATVAQHGMDGLILATLMSGVILLALGLFRLGTYIKFIPYPVTIGFTAGIAVIIFSSQLKEFFGLSLPGKEPGALIPKFAALFESAGTYNITAIVLALATMAIIIGVKKYRPAVPGMLVAVIATGLATWFFHLPVETIGTRFGGIPSSLPWPTLPDFSFDKMYAVLPNAISFALLGAIESLLSAVVADGMTGRRHRSNAELVAQGVANIGSAIFGGICATGTIARTATNVRSNAHGPVSGMLHAVFVLLFMLIAAPLASFIPLSALAAVLVLVAWNMAERHEFMNLMRTSRADMIVLFATFFLTIFYGLTEAIVVGFALSTLIFMSRMKATTTIEHHEHTLVIPDDGAEPVPDSHVVPTTNPHYIVYRMSGPFFFGAAAAIGALLDQIVDLHKVLVLDFTGVPYIDSTAANTMAGLVRKANRQGTEIYITGIAATIRKSLSEHGVSPPQVHYKSTINRAAENLSLRAVKEQPAYGLFQR